MPEWSEQWFGLSWGALAAITGMKLATYACRAGGFWLMQHVPLTARVRRGLNALPGSIVVATVVPLALRGSLPAIIGIGCAFIVMARLRNELIALIAGLLAVTLARAAGL